MNGEPFVLLKVSMATYSLGECSDNPTTNSTPITIQLKYLVVGYEGIQHLLDMKINNKRLITGYNNCWILLLNKYL